MASYKVSSALEKFITLGTAAIIGLWLVFGVVTARGLHSALEAEDKVQTHLNQGKKSRDQISDLLFYQQEQISGSVNFLITGQPRPYLDQANTARNAFLASLRDIREKNTTPAINDYLDRIGQTEMDYQLSLAKAIEARRKGPYFMAVVISVQTFVQPRRAALNALLENFNSYSNSLFENELKRLEAASTAASKSANRAIWVTGVGVLAISSAILFLNMLLLAKRHRKEKKALQSEVRLRTALEAAETDWLDLADRA